MCSAPYRLAICIAIGSKPAHASLRSQSKVDALYIVAIRLNSISHSAYIGVTTGPTPMLECVNLKSL